MGLTNARLSSPGLLNSQCQGLEFAPNPAFTELWQPKEPAQNAVQ
jgi:hypothetical protein